MRGLARDGLGGRHQLLKVDALAAADPQGVAIGHRHQQVIATAQQQHSGGVVAVAGLQHERLRLGRRGIHSRIAALGKVGDGKVV